MDILEQNQNTENKFHAWVNNRMAVILMDVERPRKRTREYVMKAHWFLENLEHHFIDPYTTKSVRDAFRYLFRYLFVKEETRKKHSSTAKAMIKTIYAELGYELTV